MLWPMHLVPLLAGVIGSASYLPTREFGHRRAGESESFNPAAGMLAHVAYTWRRHHQAGIWRNSRLGEL